MCGIFGVIVKKDSGYSPSSINSVIKTLALFSESRGKDSSGLAVVDDLDQKVDVVKGNIRVKSLMKERQVKLFLEKAGNTYKSGKSNFASFGHARLVTNGSQLEEVNNQPVLKDANVLIHNGIIVNADELWKSNSNLKREYSIDSEVIAALMNDSIETSSSIEEGVLNSLSTLEGTFSIASYLAEYNSFLLASNNGSLYYLTDEKSFIVFASEQYYLKKLLKEKCYNQFSEKTSEIKQIKANQALLLNLDSFSFSNFILNKQLSGTEKLPSKKSVAYSFEKHIIKNTKNTKEVVIDPESYIDRSKESHLYKLLEYNQEKINKLKRCTKCVLPETFPFIDFDSKGVCNYCNNYKPKQYSNTLEELKKLVEPYRRTDGKPDCIVPFSGGRDSTYSLHLIKKELGLNPIAFTYDWGMVTDLARRNIARVCGKLGVENIIVSADMNWKRENIRKNVEAWLKKPSLGMIPLFMAGDKYFFYYTDRLKKQTGIDLNLWGINHLENTDFKVGFAGIPPKFDKKRIYSLSIKNQLKLFGFVGGNLLKSPGYINQSIFDSLGSFAARYLSSHKDFYSVFDFYKWDEDEINTLLEKEYEWEKAIDTNSTWRIGDGTASFYNYIYYTVAGFSEVDTFRSNQIREGMLTRERALQLIEDENKPRYETLRWYLEIIGVDFEKAIKTVNSIPKLY